MYPPYNPKSKRKRKRNWLQPKSYLIVVLLLSLIVLVLRFLSATGSTDSPKPIIPAKATTNEHKTSEYQEKSESKPLHKHNQHSPAVGTHEGGTGSHGGKQAHKHMTHFEKLPHAPWAITYSPLQGSGSCKTFQDIIMDIQKIKQMGVKAVRLYSTDCGVLEAIEPTTDTSRRTFRAMKIDMTQKLDVVVGLFPYLEEEEEQEENQEGDSEGSQPVQPQNVSKWFSSLEDQMADIVKWDRWDRVSLLSVGSGGVFDESYSRGELVAMIRHVKRMLKSVYGHPEVNITTAEPVQSYVSTIKFNSPSIETYHQYLETVAHGDVVSDANDYDDLCSVVDVIGLTVQPFFNSAIAPESAGSLVQRDLKFAQYLCSDKFIGSVRDSAEDESFAINNHARSTSAVASSSSQPIVILEAGWPSQGLENGEAAPGIEEQQAAISSILTARNPRSGEHVDIALYTFEDELWREPGVLSVETHFGVSQLF